LTATQETRPEDLAELPLLMDLKPGDREWLFQFFQKISFERDAIICRQDDIEKDIYIITKGQVEVSRDLGSEMLHIETLVAPTVTGEMSFIDNLPRSATVRAMEDVEALILPFNDFQKLMVESPIVAFHFLFSIGRLVSTRLRTTLDRLAEIENST